MITPAAVDPNGIAAYIRWSTDEQGDGTTLEVQREACEHYIRSQGWNFRPDLLFVDDGHSGGSLDRPGLRSLRKAVKSRRVCCCVVYKLDRLSRSVLDTVKLVLEEWEGLCYVKAAREPVDTTTPTGKVFFYMLASYAEWERGVIRERTLSGKVKRAQQGRNPGFAYPYGYRQGQHTGAFAVDHSEAAVVRRIFAAYTQGHGAPTIAEELNRQGIRSREGGPFVASRILRMLRNPCYMGLLTYGLSTVNPPAIRQREGKARSLFETPRYASVAGALPAIVSPEEFAAAQEVRAMRATVKGRRALASTFVLTGIARCRCGAGLRSQQSPRRAPYYRCSRARIGEPERCRCALIPAAVLEDTVVTQVRKAFAAEQRGQYLADMTAAVEARRSAARSALKAVNESLVSLKPRRHRLDRDYDTGQIPGKLYARRAQELDQEEQSLLTAKAQHEAELGSLKAAAADMSRFDALAARIDGWEQLDSAERKQVLRHAVASCVAYRAPGEGRRRYSPQPVELALKIWRVGNDGQEIVVREIAAAQRAWQDINAQKI